MKTLHRISLALAMFICYLAPTQAQDSLASAPLRTIKGIVSDNVGPIPCVNVIIKGSNRGTTTDLNGAYSIQAQKSDFLVFSFLGLQTQTVKVPKKNVLNIHMQPSQNQLQEVVFVSAMGIKRTKTAYTSSERKISKKDKNTLVQGKVSGLQVNTNGSNQKIILRGNRTSTGSNTALVVIDGKVASAEYLQQLPAEVIEKVNVIKGAQGAALYGTQGVNGVVVVTTKKTNLPDELGNNLTPPTPQIEDDAITPPIAEIENDESYESYTENPFESPKKNAVSTFSIDVDNASYTNVRRFINNGQAVPKDAVRIEEMIQFFKYNYAQPTSNEPFAIHTEYSDCPWNTKHKLVRIGLKGKEIPTEKLPASNLVFLIDVSGSMSDDNKLPLVKESLKLLVGQMRKQDRIAIVVYAGAAGLVLPATSGDEKRKIIASLDQLQSGGSTAGGAGIELAYKIAQEQFIKEGNNRVVLATDGDFNVGASSDEDMQKLIEDKRKSGVFLTCLGYGMGNYKDSTLETLADKGNGNYAYIDSMQEANRFLNKEYKGALFTIAKDVKVQIEFNPMHVKAYRLIGYENRKLEAEDFVNDAIDAGEMGSGHTVTAFYEIIPEGTDSELFSSTVDLKYTKTATTTATSFPKELATVKFRYKKPNEEISNELVRVIPTTAIQLKSSSEDFKFATAVAWFGLILRDSKLVKNKSIEALLELANEGISTDSEGYREEFIRLVETKQ
jgi:Ca-activated chloride channel family protein